MDQSTNFKIDKFRHAIDNNDTVAMSIAYANIAMFISANTACDSIIVEINNIIREKIKRVYNMILLFHVSMKLLYNIIVFAYVFAYLISVVNKQLVTVITMVIMVDFISIILFAISYVTHKRCQARDVYFDVGTNFCETMFGGDISNMIFGMVVYPFESSIFLINFIYAFIMIISFFVLRNQTKLFTILYIDENTHLPWENSTI